MHLASIKVPCFLRRGRNKIQFFCRRDRKNTLFSAEEAGNKKTSVFYRRGRTREQELSAVEAGNLFFATVFSAGEALMKRQCFLQE